MFEIREMESDISFLRNYLTKDLVDELDLYLYQKVGNEWKIVDKDWEHCLHVAIIFHYVRYWDV
jgi:stage V sporulation protein R